MLKQYQQMTTYEGYYSQTMIGPICSGVGESNTNVENTWLGDMPGMEYNDYQQTQTNVDQPDQPMEVISFNLSVTNRT